MKAKEYLTQAFRLDNRINSKIDQIASLNDLATKCTSRMIELDEKYCDVIVKRYIEQVGNADSVNLIRDGEKQAYSELDTEATAS